MQTVLRKLARNNTVPSFKRLDEFLPLLARLSEVPPLACVECTNNFLGQRSTMLSLSNSVKRSAHSVAFEGQKGRTGNLLRENNPCVACEPVSRGFSSSRVLCTKPYIAPLETISNQQETTGYESSSDSSLQYDDFYPPDETSKNLAHNLKEERRSLEYIDEEPERSDETDDEGLRVVKLPRIHPKASITSEHHPLGAELLEFSFSARAFYVGKDYKEQSRRFVESASKEGWQYEYFNGSVLFCLREQSDPFNEEEDYTGLPCETYCLILDRLDSIVFFNGGGREKQIWEEYAGGQLTNRYTEEARVSVMPSIDTRHHLFSDRIILQQAELKYLRTIAYVMGQTVSLHHYEVSVDRIMNRFKDMNQKMHQTGSWTDVAKKQDLLQMVAMNNLLTTDIISKLGIFERFDLAWKNTDCSDIYEHLRTDMEIANRNNNLQAKLGYVSENVKYLLELMQNQKSDFLEWIIIVLITAEILIALPEMAQRLS